MIRRPVAGGLERNETMFNCTCNSDVEVAEVFEVEEITARKVYRCSECRAVIRPGQRHEYIIMLFYGHWEHYHTCAICAEIAKVAQSCGRAPGVLWEDIHKANCVATHGEEEFCICPESAWAKTTA